jgi:uncharacterized membrane protein (UPF0127 family)
MISVGGVYDAITDAREEAGGGKVDWSSVAEAIAQLEERQIKAVVATLISENGFAATFYGFVARVLDGGDAALIAKLDTYVRVYSNAAAPELARRREEVSIACDALRGDPKNEIIIASIGTTLRRWNEIGRPLQLFESHMHREDALARDLYLHVRALCLWLANEKELYVTAQKITKACAEVFKELPRAIGQMQEEGESLAQLHNQKIATTVLEPLSKACEEAQQNQRRLEREVLRNGLGPASKGVAKTLYDNFVRAVAATEPTEFSDLPWRLVRAVAISLNNDSKSPKAAAAVINGLIEYFHFQRPSDVMVETLEKDKQASQKNIVQGEFEISMAVGQWASAAMFVDQLLMLETDADELASLREVRDAIAAKRKSNKIKTWGWAAAAAVLILIVANQGDRPSSSTTQMTPSTSRPSTQQAPVPAPATIVRPPVGTDLSFTQGNLRYCVFQEIRMEAMRPLTFSESSQFIFNAMTDDWNSRCSKYRYQPSDKSVVDAEVVSRRSALEAEGREIANIWATAPTFSKSELTIDTASGQRRFSVELALTRQQWLWGTSFRNSMPADAGMLYIYPAPRILSNGMRTAYFSLDVLFIDENGQIAESFERRAPRSEDRITSKAPGKTMLELNGGAVQRLGIKVGDMVRTVDANKTSPRTR